MDHQPNSGWIWPAPTPKPTPTTTPTPALTPTPTPTKRKAEYYESWEERAFAEDAGGVLGSSGCVWPPRSYSCSFCRREFRSAQALGGHMNVHRRDRARLKQLPNTPQSPPPNQTLIPDSTFPKPDLNHKKCPSQSSTTLLYGPNPNPNSNLHYSNNILLMSHRRPNYAEPSISEAVNTKCLNSDLSISLNLVVRRSIHGDEASSCFKRRKIVATTSPPLIFSSKSGETDHNNNLLLPHSTSSKEIDLELRLGG